MNKEIKEKIRNIFYENNGYVKTKDIISHSINKIHINNLLEKEVISKVKRGLYKWDDFEHANEIAEVSKIVPNGVICLVSALSHYKLITYTPSEYQIAVCRQSKVILSDYPPVKLFYFSEKFYSAGITTVNIEGNIVKVYNVEKTIIKKI